MTRSKQSHAAGFTLRYRREPPRRGLPHRSGSPAYRFWAVWIL
ncbi:hypothetical protein [Nostoc sp.]